MPITITALSNRVYRRLNESANTDLGILDSGTGDVATLARITAIVDYYNEVVGELCRTCLPIYAKATYSSVPTGAFQLSLSSFTVNTAGVSGLWCTTEANYGGTALPSVGLLQITSWFGWTGGIISLQSGTTQYYCDQGENGQIMLVPPPLLPADLVVGGLGIPTLATAGTDTTSAFIPDDLLELVEYRICSLLCKKNVDNPQLAGRIVVWDSLYDQRRLELWNRIDLHLRQWRYPNSPVAMGQTEQ